VPRRVLTDRLIASLKPASRAVYFDTKARGLALRVTPGRTRTWAFVYRRQGKPQWLTLGSYPALTLADARALALDHRHAIDVEKRDPAAEQRAEREAAQVPAPVRRPFRRSLRSRISPSCTRNLPAVAKRPGKTTSPKSGSTCFPRGGRCPFGPSRVHVHELLDSLSSQGMTVGVNRVALISRLFTLALDRSLVDAHPVARMIARATPS